MPRRRAHRAERLSDAARAVVEEGLQRGVGYAELAELVQQKTGEEISASALQRFYAAKFKPEQRARMEATVIADRLADRLCGLDDQALQQAIKLRTAEALLPMLTDLAADSPQHAARFFADLDFNRVEYAKVEQRREELEARAHLAEQRLELERGKLARVAEAAKAALKKGGAKTPASVRKAIADIYGITISDAPDGDDATPSSSPSSADGSVAAAEVRS